MIGKKKLQQIQAKRGFYGRRRRKRWLWFKNRGLEDLYSDRFKTQTPKPVVEIAQESAWWRKLIISIQKFFYNLFHAK